MKHLSDLDQVAHKSAAAAQDLGMLDSQMSSASLDIPDQKFL